MESGHVVGACVQKTSAPSANEGPVHSDDYGAGIVVKILVQITFDLANRLLAMPGSAEYELRIVVARLRQVRPTTCAHDLQCPDAPLKPRCTDAPRKPRCGDGDREWEARDACGCGYSEMETWSSGIAEWIQGWTWVYGCVQRCESGDWGGGSGIETWNGDHEGDAGVDRGLWDCDLEIIEWIQGMGSCVEGLTIGSEH
ncbi:hypothetical protein HOY80DRAFT_1138811 [Tuber brumale]|nr:hypothetical protein HOY80DRAFT_1138811 [Tuber brumale]